MRKLIKLFGVLCLSVLIVVLSTNAIVVLSIKSDILMSSELTSVATSESDFDCILVLGCGVIDGSPSVMLADRLNKAVELYSLGVAPKILMSGDHGTEQYDEVNVMREYAVNAGVPEEDIFMDHAGFSTYESMRRASVIFGCERIVVVTQRYHLYRAMYDAERSGIDAYGCIADGHTFVRQPYYTGREIFARVKDFFLTLFNPNSAYVGGERIDIHGNGKVTLG